MLMKGMFVADCIEYGSYATGERAEGISFSIRTFVSKLSTALSAFFAGIILDYIGFVPNISQTESTLKGIFVLATIVPAIGMILASLIIVFFYDLSEGKVKEMIAEMDS